MIDPNVTARVRTILGPLYDEMLQVMIDLATPPVFLFADDRARLVDVRERSAAILRAWAADHSDDAAALVNLLPRVMQGPDVAESLLETSPWADYFRLPASTFELPRVDAPVFAALPSLLELADDDGLLDVDGVDARPHGLFIDDFSLHYHQLLRRGFGSNIHYDLIGSVLGLARRKEEVCARIAIDERRLRRRDEHREVEERDYWYGPQLDETKLDDLTALGETIHGDPECGRSILCPYWAASIRWKRDGAGPMKSVEVEEFMPRSDEASGLVLVRYLHAIRDVERRAFVHCDGAVKAYDRSAYPTVLEDFPRRGKGLHYRKVFRLDGPLTANEWSHVTALWFRGNPLVLEYLAGLANAEPAA